MEMSLRNLLSGDAIDHADFLARVDILAALGKRVIISNFAYYYGLAEYLRFYTRRPIVFALGVPNARRLFDEGYYRELDGGILEAFGRLFRSGIRLYVHPCRDPNSGDLLTVENLSVPREVRHLLAHLLESRRIVPIRDADDRNLNVFPKEVLRMIQSGNPGWENLVPQAGVRLIKERGVFGYRTQDRPRRD
jgi:hypothetical protein